MYSFKSIKEIHEAFDQKVLTPTELTESYLSRIKKDSLNAFLFTCEDRALKQAKTASELLAHHGKVPKEQYPLFGIPIGVKDNMTIDGVRTTCASKILENYVPPYSATAVERLEASGAISLGKLNMDEFAMGGSNENSAFGPVKHPLFPDRVPGGSSGGSAAAVKAGLCVAALGSDTGGSIRLPASYCGIVGVKPTYGRVSRFGLVAFASSLDQIGSMANTVEDAGNLLQVMSGHDPKDSTSSPHKKENFLKAAQTPANLKGLRIGVPTEYFAGKLEKGVDAAIQKSLKWFESEGAELISISLPHTEYSVAVYYIVAVCEASSNLARYDGVKFGVRPPSADHAPDLMTFYKKVRALFGPEVKRRIILGTFALSSGYYDAYYRKACQVRNLVKMDFDQAFQKVDLIFSPVSATTAFKLGEKIEDPLQMYLNDLLTIPVNLAGLPALSIPCGEDERKLPVGLHMIAPAFHEERLLSVAAAFEKGRT